jgi:hypothetical protein
VTRIEEERHLGLFGGAAELDKRLDQRPPVEISAAEHLETERREARRQVPGVILRVTKRGDVLIGGISNHQRDAFLRRHGLDQTRRQQNRKTKKPEQCQRESPCAGPLRAGGPI